MNRSLKTLLVWLLMAILPLQAFAASVGMSCAPNHRETGALLEPARPAHHGMGADVHAHHGDHAGASAAPASDTHTPDAQAEHQTHSSCSACSALCIGAVAPPSAFLPIPTFDGSDAFRASPSAIVPGFIPEGPQRPPRRHSA